MSLIIRVVVAVLVGIIVTGLLNYFQVLTPHLNSLLGFLAAVVMFFGYDHYFGDTRR